MFRFFILIAIFSLSGCATKYTPGEMKAHYKPYTHFSAGTGNGVLVKASKGTRFWKIDGKRIASIPSMMFGGGYDAIKVSPGKHSFSASRGVDLNVRGVELKQGNEYYLNHLQADKRIYYWLENTTTKEVVWGTRKTQAMLEEKE